MIFYHIYLTKKKSYCLVEPLFLYINYFREFGMTLDFFMTVKTYRGFSTWLDVSELPVRASLERNGLLVLSQSTEKNFSFHTTFTACSNKPLILLATSIQSKRKYTAKPTQSSVEVGTSFIVQHQSQRTAAKLHLLSLMQGQQEEVFCVFTFQIASYETRALNEHIY